MRNEEPETAADVIRDLCKEYGLSPDQRISTLEKACEEFELGNDDDWEDGDYEDVA